MNDIQKAIDEFMGDFAPLSEYPRTVFYDQLKSLLEKVAKEQRKKCFKYSNEDGMHYGQLIEIAPLVTDNLTFNED